MNINLLVILQQQLVMKFFSFMVRWLLSAQISMRKAKPSSKHRNTFSFLFYCEDRYFWKSSKNSSILHSILQISSVYISMLINQGLDVYILDRQFKNLERMLSEWVPSQRGNISSSITLITVTQESLSKRYFCRNISISISQTIQSILRRFK